jgi:hypothetical protein
MKYNCTSCDYSTDDRSNWAKHNKAQSHLNKVDEVINSKKSLADNKTTGHMSGHLSGHMSGQQSGHMSGHMSGQLSGQLSDTQNDVVNVVNKPKFICPYCDQSFSLKENLSRHKNHRCSKNPR